MKAKNPQSLILFLFLGIVESSELPDLVHFKSPQPDFWCCCLLQAPLIFEENCSSLQIEWIITESKSKQGHEALLGWLSLPLPSLFNATLEKWPKLMGNYKSPQCIEQKEQFYFQGSFLIRTLCSIWTGVCLKSFCFSECRKSPL